MKRKYHFMVDLETLGTAPDSPITQIAIAHFNPFTGEIDDSLELIIKPDFTLTNPSVRTLAWWLTQSEQARIKMAAALKDGIDEASAMKQLTEFIERVSIEHDSVCIWGNGAVFDNTMLEAAYRRHGLPQPWSYQGNRCYRTLRSLVEPDQSPKVDLVGIEHSALDDVIYQVKVMKALLEILGITHLN